MFLDRRPTIPTIPMNSPRRMTGSVQLERHLLFHTTQATLCHHCTFCSRYFPLPIILFSLPILASLLHLLHLPLLGSQYCMALWGTGCNVPNRYLEPAWAKMVILGVVFAGAVVGMGGMGYLGDIMGRERAYCLTMFFIVRNQSPATPAKLIAVRELPILKWPRVFLSSYLIFLSLQTIILAPRFLFLRWEVSPSFWFCGC